MKTKKISPVHPGEILMKEFFGPQEDHLGKRLDREVRVHEAA